MSLSDAAPGPISETIAGRTYDIAPLTMAALGRLQRFLDTLPCPRPAAAVKAKLDALREAGLISDDEAAKRRVEAVNEELEWPPEILFDPRCRAVFMYDERGQVELLRVALGLASDDEAAAIAGSISMEQFLRVYAAAFAVRDEGPADPKGSGSTAA